MDELVIRRVSYGLELVDELTQGPLVGSSRVSFVLSGTWSGPEPVAYLVNRSRWVFEELNADVTFTIEAPFYYSQIISVAAAALTGTVQRVVMRPAVGYPFPTSLTRVIGFARLTSGVPVAGAEVQVQPEHEVDPGVFINGPPLPPIFTDTQGQYVAWFLPQIALSDPEARPTASRFQATATATVDLGSGPVVVTGSIANQNLKPDTLNNAAIIDMM